MGRPATHYGLTPAGDHLFPKNYDGLSVAFIDALAEEFGHDAPKRLLARVSEERVKLAMPAMRDLPLAQRVELLKSWYGEGDPYMDLEKVGEDYRLVERNCPFLNVALRRPALCSVSVNALTRVLGVRVDREESFQGGDGRCVFRIHADQPVDPEAWEFKLESEMNATPPPGVQGSK
jgi:predicted ArsR family transcriptional regulator